MKLAGAVNDEHLSDASRARFEVAVERAQTCDELRLEVCRDPGYYVGARIAAHEHRQRDDRKSRKSSQRAHRGRSYWRVPKVVKRTYTGSL